MRIENAPKSDAEQREMLSQHLAYEMNNVRNSLFTARHHPSYISQADMRRMGQQLKGAISLATRLIAVIGSNAEFEAQLLFANELARKAIEFRK